MQKNDAIKIAGSIRALSMLLGVTRSTVQGYKEALPRWRVEQLYTEHPNLFKEKNVKRAAESRSKKMESKKAASKKTH